LFEEAEGRLTPEVKAHMEYAAMEALRRTMRPEFLNRIDEIVLFEPLTRAHVKDILNIQLRGLSERLEAAGVELCVSDEAMEWMGDQGYSLAFGARPMKRLVQREVLNRLSKALLAGKLAKDRTQVLDVFDGEVVFRDQLPDDHCVAIASLGRAPEAVI
jgi:ATP-dependent Clp protease ATP-binding subunit ClpB